MSESATSNRLPTLGLAVGGPFAFREAVIQAASGNGGAVASTLPAAGSAGLGGVLAGNVIFLGGGTAAAGAAFSNRIGLFDLSLRSGLGVAAPNTLPPGTIGITGPAGRVPAPAGPNVPNVERTSPNYPLAFPANVPQFDLFTPAPTFSTPPDTSFITGQGLPGNVPPSGASGAAGVTNPTSQVAAPRNAGTPSQQAVLPNIQATIPEPNFIGQIPFFLNAVLSTPAGALPKGPLWVVVFDGFPEIVKKVGEYEPSLPEPWEIEKAYGTITSSRYQQEKGCILAQSVTIPGEALITNVEGNQYNSFIRGRVGLGRQDFDLLRIAFLNTNVLFVDNVVRPWVVMTGHLGMIARPPQENYRSNITVYKLGVVNRETPPYILQRYNFWGCCPVSIDTETLTYRADSNDTVKIGNFAFQWYTVSSAKNPFAQGAPSQDLRGTLDGQTVAQAIDPRAPIAVERAIPVR